MVERIVIVADLYTSLERDTGVVAERGCCNIMDTCCRILDRRA